MDVSNHENMDVKVQSSKNTKVCTLIFFVLVLIAEKIAGFLYVVRAMQEVTVYKYKNFIL